MSFMNKIDEITCTSFCSAALVCASKYMYTFVCVGAYEFANVFYLELVSYKTVRVSFTAQ